MDQTSFNHDGDPAVAASGEARLDVRQREIVNDGIRMQQHTSTMSALEYLKSRDVCPLVIARVLVGARRGRGLD
jgi:hypothetical protein